MKKNRLFNYITDSENKKKLLKQILKFIIVGGIATVIDWILYFILCNYLNVHPLIANIISYSIATIYNFFGSVKYVFNVSEEVNRKRIFIIFIVLCLIGLLLSELLIYIMVTIFVWQKMIAKVIATIIVMTFNFITRKFFLEKKK